MHYSSLLLWLVSLSQITSGTPGTGIPEDATIFTVTYKDGAEEKVINAAVKAGGAFLTEFDRSKAPQQVELFTDTPWAPAMPKKVLTQSLRVVEREPSIKRDQRYKDSGFVQLESAKGKIWVSEETLSRAKRAEQLQAELKSEQLARVQAYAPAADSAGGEHGGLGFVQLWSRHVVILVTAVVLIVSVIKICF